MLLGFFSVLMILMVGYAYLREGLFTGFVMCVNVLISGLIAMNYFEPLANAMGSLFSGMFLSGYEDFLSLILLFSASLGGLRTLTNFLVPAQVQFPTLIQRPGGFVTGAMAGYLASGFLVVALQTLPWHEQFMYYEPSTDAVEGLRQYLPGERIWLAMMHRAGAYSFANDEDPLISNPENLYEKYRTFDKFGTFIYRYTKYRRFGDSTDPGIYAGELNREIDRGVP